MVQDVIRLELINHASELVKCECEWVTHYQPSDGLQQELNTVSVK